MVLHGAGIADSTGLVRVKWHGAFVWVLYLELKFVSVL